MSSIKDVAKLAGVSVATVSRVLNQSAFVEEDTRIKVEDAVKKLQYTPNLLARGLRQQSGLPESGTSGSNYAVYNHYREYAKAGKLYPGSPGKGKKLGFAGVETHTFCMAVQQDVIKQTNLAGFDEKYLIILNNHYSIDIALKNAEFMLSQQPDLFIEYQADAKVNHIVADSFEEVGIPLLSVDIPVPGAPFVGVNNWRVAKMGGGHMAKLIQEKWGGWKAVDLIVLLQNPEGGEVTMLRSEGFAAALAEVYGDTVVEEKIVRVDGGLGKPKQAKAAMDEILATYPDAKKIAVTSVNEETMAGVIAALQKADQWNPDDNIIVTLGVDDLGKSQIRKGFSDAGVAFFPEKYGEYLIPAACAILEGAPVPSHMYVENEIITRENLDQFYP